MNDDLQCRGFFQNPLSLDQTDFGEIRDTAEPCGFWKNPRHSRHALRSNRRWLRRRRRLWLTIG